MVPKRDRCDHVIAYRLHYSGFRTLKWMNCEFYSSGGRSSFGNLITLQSWRPRERSKKSFLTVSTFFCTSLFSVLETKFGDRNRETDLRQHFVRRAAPMPLEVQIEGLFIRLGPLQASRMAISWKREREKERVGAKRDIWQLFFSAQ